TNEGTQIHRLPPVLRATFAAALKPAFLAAACVAGLVWIVAVLWVKEVPLRRSVDELSPAEAAAGTPHPGVQQRQQAGPGSRSSCRSGSHRTASGSCRRRSTPGPTSSPRCSRSSPSASLDGLPT